MLGSQKQNKLREFAGLKTKNYFYMKKLNKYNFVMGLLSEI